MTTRSIQLFCGLAVALACALSLHAMVLRLPFGLWPSLPFDPSSMSLDQIIVAFSLMPRVVVSILAGAMLGLSGALFQLLLRNPIADPSTLGISAGAQLAIVIATLFFPKLWTETAHWWHCSGLLWQPQSSFCLDGAGLSNRSPW